MMYATLTVRDETSFNIGGNGYEFRLELPSNFVTVRELIRTRMRQEVEHFNLHQPEHFRGLVQPSDAEKTLNGYKLNQRRRIDWEQQFEKALDSFQRNGFLLLVDDQQVESLDEIIEVRPQTSVTFLKLVPLVGG